MNVTSPRTLDEALDALAAATPSTQLLAGGTDLVVEMRIGRTRPDGVIDLWAVDELRGIGEDDGALRLGALTSCSALCRDSRVPDVLVAAAREVGGEQIRNRATIGGNLGTASPAADLNPVLLALDALVALRSRGGVRQLPVAEFLTGYRETARRPDELIEAVVIPARPPEERRGFRKVGTRRAQAISKVVVATATVLGEDVVRSCRAAAGCVADRTVLLPTLERELVGRRLERAAVEAAARASVAADCAPIDDVRSTARYRREVLFRVIVSLLGADG